MSNSGGIEAFDSELIRAFLNSQNKTTEGGSLAAAKQILESRIKENVTQAGSDKVTSQLLSLLNKLELTSQIISQLKESLTEINNLKDSNLQKLNIPTEAEFEDPVKLAEALKSYDYEVILKEVKKVKESIALNTNVSVKDREAIEEIEESIKAVLKELKPFLDKNAEKNAEKNVVRLIPQKDQETPVINKDNLISTEKLLAFERALDKLSLSREFLSLDKSADKLMQLLHTVAGRKDYSPLDDNKLKEVIKQQIDLLKNIEEPIKKLLISPSSEGQLTTLLRVLENIKVDELPVSNPLQQKYKEFILELTKNLHELIAKSAPETEIKEFLLKVLETIYKEFKLEPLEIRLLKGFEFEGIKEFLKPEQIVNLKLIEAQITLILNSPKESLFEQVKGENAGEFKLALKAKELKVLLDLLEKPEAKEAAAKIKPLIQELLKGGTLPEAAEKEVRKALNEIKDSGFLRDAIEKTVHNNSQKLDDKQTAQLKLLADLIKEVLQNEINLIGDLSDKAVLEKLISSPSFKNLMQLLKRADQSLPEPHNAMENDFVEFAGSLLDKIDKAKSGSTSKLSENLSKALEKLEVRFLNNLTPEKESVLTPLNLSALKNLENMASSQDMFQRLNPLMRGAGEPVVLLFPFVMQGMLSRLEVNIVAKELDEEPGRKKKRKGNNKYESIKFSLKLPNLGNVTVNLLHNQDEIFALLSFDNPVIAERIEPSLVRLESILRSSGYEKVNVSTSSGKFAGDTSNWVSKLLKNLR